MLELEIKELEIENGSSGREHFSFKYNVNYLNVCISLFILIDLNSFFYNLFVKLVIMKAQMMKNMTKN